jgi:hypothetical protein
LRRSKKENPKGLLDRGRRRTLGEKSPRVARYRERPARWALYGGVV